MDKVTRLPLDHDRAVERRRLHIREVAEGGGEQHATVGAELKAARLRLGEDLRTVAAALRIRPEHLEAMEEGAFDKLPGRAYAIGFVRAYAEYLGLDSSVIVARFKEEAGGLPEPSNQPVLFDETPDEPEQPQGMLIGLLVVFALAIGGAVYFSNSANQMLGQRAAGEAGTATPAPKVEVHAEAPPPPQTAAPEASAPAVAAPESPTIETGHTIGTADAGSRITVRALRDGVWLRVEDQASGEVLLTRKLQAGDRYLVPNRPNLVLVTRDGGSLELTLDGTPIGRAGGPGTVVDGMALNPDVLAGRLPASATGTEAAPAPAPPAAAPAPLKAPAKAKPATPPDPAPATPPAPAVAPDSAPAAPPH
jgi:cytoskeleton protein RodZ